MPQSSLAKTAIRKTKGVAPSVVRIPAIPSSLSTIEHLTRDAEQRWKSKLVLETALSRALVSYQANKGRAVYRWFKYKEGFSAGLIEYLLHRYRVSKGVLLDPFAGSGTALFAAGARGMRAEGIELLPIGQTVIATKQLIDFQLQPRDVDRLITWLKEQPWKNSTEIKAINALRITRGAYPEETVVDMGKFLATSEQEN